MPNRDDAALRDSTAATASGTDRRTPPARAAAVAASVGYALDGFDFLILGFALPAISHELILSQPQAGALATVTLVGAVLGGLTFGVVADRIGRARTLSYSIVFFALCTGLTALSHDYATLAAFRFLAGIGIGGEFGIGMTLVAETWPNAKRARGTAIVAVGWQLGVLLAAFVSAPVLTYWGWRGLFLLGAVPALVAVAFRVRLTEPVLFQEARAAGRPANRRPLGSLVADPAVTRAGVGVLVLTSVQNFGYYGLMTWLPTYLATTFHFGLTRSAMWTAVTVAGMVLGILAFGQLADRIGRRTTFWCFQFGAFASVLVYSQLTSQWALLVGGAVMGAFANGMMGGLGALIAELYPTAARSTATNVLFNLGRGVGGFAPIAVAVVAAGSGFGFAIALLSGIYLLAMLAMFLIPELRGRNLV